MSQTTAEMIAEKQALRAACKEALIKAYKAQSVSTFGLSKQMATINDLRRQLKEYDAELAVLEATDGSSDGFVLNEWIPE